MRADVSIELPLGVKIGSNVPLNIDRSSGTAQAEVQLVRAERHWDGGSVNVGLEIDVDIEMIFGKDSGERAGLGIIDISLNPSEHEAAVYQLEQYVTVLIGKLKEHDIDVPPKGTYRR
jgi:hypothetical protein